VLVLVCACVGVRVLVLDVCILAMQRPGVCSLCLYPLDAPFGDNKIHPLSKNMCCRETMGSTEVYKMVLTIMPCLFVFLCPISNIEKIFMHILVFRLH